jgi:hypothetical protein
MRLLGTVLIAQMASHVVVATIRSVKVAVAWRLKSVALWKRLCRSLSCGTSLAWTAAQQRTSIRHQGLFCTTPVDGVGMIL